MFLYTETATCDTMYRCASQEALISRILLSEKDFINSLLVNHITIGKKFLENILILFLN